MKTLPALCLVLVAGTAIGFAVPMPEGEGALVPAVVAEVQGQGPEPEQMVEPKLAVTQDTSDAGWAREVALLREADGHFYADVAIDGYRTRMLVDTGASVIALTGADAAAMGMFWEDAEVKPLAEGASGPVYGVHTVLPRVTVGGFEAENVSAMIIPEGLQVSLLGQSFLSEVDKVEISGDQLVLSN